MAILPIFGIPKNPRECLVELEHFDGQLFSWNVILEWHSAWKWVSKLLRTISYLKNYSSPPPPLTGLNIEKSKRYLLACLEPVRRQWVRAFWRDWHGELPGEGQGEGAVEKQQVPENTSRPWLAWCRSTWCAVSCACRSDRACFESPAPPPARSCPGAGRCSPQVESGGRPTDRAPHQAGQHSVGDDPYCRLCKNTHLTKKLFSLER